MTKIAAIIVGAGSGTRFGGAENKIFAKLDGQPLFLRAVQLFVNRDDVCQTILVVSPSDLPQIKAKFGANLGFMGVQVVEGGAERADSVAAALAAVSDDAEYVAVHDAARPCVASEWIDAVVAEATKSGAAIPAVPLTATLKRVSAAGVIDATVPRENLWAAQTPQVFRRDVLLAAYAKRGSGAGTPSDSRSLSKGEGRGEGSAAAGSTAAGSANAGSTGAAAPTDDAQLVESIGHPVSVVTGDARNIKITLPSDLSLAAAVLKTMPQPKPRGGALGAFDEARW